MSRNLAAIQQLKARSILHQYVKSYLLYPLCRLFTHRECKLDIPWGWPRIQLGTLSALANNNLHFEQC